jgi:hypothetical protein
MNNGIVYSNSNTSYQLGETGVWSKLLRRVKILDVLALLVPVSQFIEIDVVGRLFMPDILLACMLPILFFAHGQRLRKRLPMIFILLAILWLFGQVTTDIIRASAYRDYVRGWAKIVFTIVNFSTLYLLLYDHRRRLILYAVGLSVGGLISYFVNPSVFAVDHPWKFGFGASITWFLILLAAAIVRYRQMGAYVSSGLLVSVAAINIFMGFRSLGGICFLAGCYLFLHAWWGQRFANVPRRPREMLLIGMVLTIAGVGVYQMYGYTAKIGLLGEGAKEKYELQVSGEYGLLLGGRNEMLVSSRAIKDSPFLGHGSWAKDYQYSSLLIELMRQAGYIIEVDTEEGEFLIPTHSHLLGAWVEAGLLGAIFWAWVLSLPVRFLLSYRGTMDCLTPLMAFFALLLIWDILFSPYGAMQRFLIPYYIVILMTYLGANHRAYNAKIIQ